MQTRFGLVLSAALIASHLPAQDSTWVASVHATGWCRADLTGACAFYAPGERKIHLWTEDGSLQAEVPTQRVEESPDAFFMDSFNRAWIAAGTQIFCIDGNGKVVERRKLPARVADMAWDGTHFYLSYRSTTPYFEKRTIKNGAVAWSQGTEPTEISQTAEILHRIALSSDGSRLFIASGNELGFTVVDTKNGSMLQPVALQPAPPLPSSFRSQGAERPLLRQWYGTDNFVFAATTSELNQSGPAHVHLLILNPGTRQLTQRNTGLEPGHRFAGVVEGKAVFTKPGGGLVFFALQ